MKTSGILGILTGIGLIILGLVVYPYIVLYVAKPITDLATALFPGMTAWETAYIAFIPLGILLFILYFGITRMFSKSKGGDR